MTTIIGPDAQAASGNGQVPIGERQIPAAGFDRDVLNFFADRLAQTTLTIGAPDFEALALVAIRAKRQLMAALSTEPPPPPDDA